MRNLRGGYLCLVFIQHFVHIPVNSCTSTYSTMSSELTLKSSSDVMRELELCENNVIDLLRIANETMEEMQRIPQCDSERIEQLSSQYLSKLQLVQEKMKLHSQILNVPNKNSESASSEQATTFLDKQQDEISKALQILGE